MHAHRQRMVFVAAGVALALAVAGAAAAAVAARGSTAKATIKVTEREYHIGLSATSVKAGSVTFVVHNAGKIVHKLDLAGGGLKATVKVPTIAPGTTRSVTVKLTGGKLSLWCPVPGHAALGMKTSLKVSGAAAGGSAWG
jgi:plastocyanin